MLAFIYLIKQVESVPLEEIRKASLMTEKLLCDKLDWAAGIEAAKACQVINKQTNKQTIIHQIKCAGYF